MKKLFKLLWILELVGALRGHRRHGYHGGYGYRRSRGYYPLYQSHHRPSLVEHALRRLLRGRRY
ncbi:MAG: hypothetical protein ACK4SZ_17030 [Allosphingosinicella sp.]|uniref:hypothetical protein n=1 Tax=Allosphingosinicella sp. TaxID=2823234 RepID=UPI00395C5D79